MVQRHLLQIRTGTVPAATMAEGRVPDQPVAEHGLSLLLTITKGQDSHTLLFDTGVSPDGMVANMDRLAVDPRDVEAIVRSHGHFDHTTGLDGLIRRVGVYAIFGGFHLNGPLFERLIPRPICAGLRGHALHAVGVARRALFPVQSAARCIR